MELWFTKIIFPLFLFPILSLVAGQVIQGASECTDARGFELCQNFLSFLDNAAEWQRSTELCSTSSSVAWSTEYDWDNTNNTAPRSFANVESKVAKALQLDILPVLTAAWTWEYKTRSNLLRAVVGLTIWIGRHKQRVTGSTAEAFEIKIWLANAGGVDPPGSKTAEAPGIAGYNWNIWKSVKGSVQTLIFVNQDETDIDQFDGDLGEFIEYLTEAVEIPVTYYIQSIRAGTEVYSGTAHFLTSIYTLWVEYPED